MNYYAQYYSRLVIVVTILCSAVTCIADNSHDAKVVEIRNTLIQSASNLGATIANIEAQLRIRKVTMKDIPLARARLEQFQKLPYWRDLSSRTTRKQYDAKSNLERYLKETDDILALPRAKLASCKIAEYEAWKKANPKEAAMLELTVLADKAKQQAEVAESKAEAARQQEEERNWRSQNTQSYRSWSNGDGTMTTERTYGVDDGQSSMQWKSWTDSNGNTVKEIHYDPIRY